jgi:hypothetical protein
VCLEGLPLCYYAKCFCMYSGQVAETVHVSRTQLYVIVTSFSARTMAIIYQKQYLYFHPVSANMPKQYI